MSTQLNLEPKLTLNTNYQAPKAFIVVGCGGTGGYFLPHLARQVSISNGLRKIEGLDEHKILLIDADEV